jgi:uncharacterized membrane protein YbhN (UPF0104 family)
VALGLAAFAALATLGVIFVSRRAGAALPLAPGSLAWGPGAAALGLLMLDFLAGGLRLHLWVRRFEPAARYGLSLRSYLINYFAAALSPAGAASGPAQLASLVRGGLPPVRATAALLLNYVGILSGLLLVGGLAGGYLAATGSFDRSIAAAHQGVILGAVLLPVLLVPAILSLRAWRAAADGLTAAGHRLGGPAGGLLRRGGAALARGVDDYAAAAESARSGWRRTLAAGVALSGAMLVNRSAIGLLLMLALGIDGHHVEVIARQAVQALLLYFSPSPGGSGIAEASVPLFMGDIVPEGRWTEFALLWRGVTSYLGVAAGAVAAAIAFGPRGTPAPRLAGPTPLP